MITLDIPQANALDTVRRVIRSVALGATTIESIADLTTFSSRHASYRVHAARILGLLHSEGDRISLTPRGEKLLETALYTPEERAIFFSAIESSAVIQLLAPDLLTLCPPSVEELADRLFQNSKLSRETAERRAGTLISWRKYVLGQTPSVRKNDAKTENKGAIKSQRARTNGTAGGEQLSLF